jgi:hypothetical protein
MLCTCVLGRFAGLSLHFITLCPCFPHLRHEPSSLRLCISSGEAHAALVEGDLSWPCPLGFFLSRGFIPVMTVSSDSSCFRALREGLERPVGGLVGLGYCQGVRVSSFEAVNMIWSTALV